MFSSTFSVSPGDTRGGDVSSAKWQTEWQHLLPPQGHSGCYSVQNLERRFCLPRRRVAVIASGRISHETLSLGGDSVHQGSLVAAWMEMFCSEFIADVISTQGSTASKCPRLSTSLQVGTLRYSFFQGPHSHPLRWLISLPQKHWQLFFHCSGNFI